MFGSESISGREAAVRVDNIDSNAVTDKKKQVYDD